MALPSATEETTTGAGVNGAELEGDVLTDVLEMMLNVIFTLLPGSTTRESVKIATAIVRDLKPYLRDVEIAQAAKTRDVNFSVGAPDGDPLPYLSVKNRDRAEKMERAEKVERKCHRVGCRLCPSRLELEALEQAARVRRTIGLKAVALKAEAEESEAVAKKLLEPKDTVRPPLPAKCKDGSCLVC